MICSGQSGRPWRPPQVNPQPIQACYFLWDGNVHILGRDMGGCKTYGGGKRTGERALPKIFGPLQKSFWSALLWIFVQEKQSTDTWGGWKTYRTRGGPKPLFGTGVIREVFHPPLFSTPPWRPLNIADVYFRLFLFIFSVAMPAEFRREKIFDFVREFAVKYFRIVLVRDSTQQNKA